MFFAVQGFSTQMEDSGRAWWEHLPALREANERKRRCRLGTGDLRDFHPQTITKIVFEPAVRGRKFKV